MTRRELIALLGSTAVSWPPGVLAQQITRPIVGFLNSSSAQTLLIASRRGDLMHGHAAADLEQIDLARALRIRSSR
jgi:hypothetical protein